MCIWPISYIRDGGLFDAERFSTVNIAPVTVGGAAISDLHSGVSIGSTRLLYLSVAHSHIYLGDGTIEPRTTGLANGKVVF